jgi:hypothetical protein
MVPNLGLIFIIHLSVHLNCGLQNTGSTKQQLLDFSMSKALPSTARRVGSKARREPTLVTDVISGLHRKSDAKTKEWFTNYVKGTTWVGCKVPTVRKVVKEVYSQMDHESSTVDLLDPAVELLQQPECDVKLAGML